MPSHKVLKSVVHNIVQDFTSMMNYEDGDYVMGHILKNARKTQCPALLLDLVGKKVTPEELLTPPIITSAFRHIEGFSQSVTSCRSSVDFVTTATIEVIFDLKIMRRCPDNDKYIESPYEAFGRITDERGKKYESRLEGWWYPEI